MQQTPKRVLKKKLSAAELPFTKIPEKQPLLSKLTFMPKNARDILEFQPNHNAFLKTFSS